MPPERGILDRIESIAKILSLVLIPILLGVGGWMINAALKQKDVEQNYVVLALEVLRAGEGEIDPGLRRWAADLLSQSAPVPMANDLVRRLGEGQAVLPEQRRATDLLLRASALYQPAMDAGLAAALQRVAKRQLEQLAALGGETRRQRLQSWLETTDRLSRSHGYLARDAELLRQLMASMHAANLDGGPGEKAGAGFEPAIADVSKAMEA